MKILVIAAHPDDETLGVGGVIAKHTSAGDEVQVCILTDGATVRGKSVERQKQRAREACEILGVTRTSFCNLPDQYLDALPLIDVIQQIESCVKNFAPNVVYTHFKEDVNQDHRVAFEATMVATRPFEHSPVEKVLCYEVLSSTEWAPPFADTTFIPNVFVDITSTLETKIRAMKVYQEEAGVYPHPRSYEAIRAQAQLRGVTVGFEVAEAFLLVRERIR